ncbi:MAG: hypothetical protein K2H43_00450 [Clostridia bacterium]|nr:hypothetical protein [Clostridia bacterium]
MNWGLYRNFTTLLSCQGNPVVFTGTNSYKNREVVFAFDLHDTTFTMFKDYSVLISNLINYTFPKVIDEVFLYCGDRLTVNVVPNCESIRVVSPISGSPVYLPTDGTSSTFTLTEVGTYSVIVRISGGQERSYSVYSAFSEDERYPVSQEGEFLVTGEASNAKRDGKFDSLILWFILLAVLMAADWVVYCYDQYQLR